MKIDGITISDSDECKIRGSSGDVGPFGAAYAYLYVHNENGKLNIYAVTEISSGLTTGKEMALLNEEFSVKLVKEGNGDEEGGVLVQITSGEFEGELLHIKIAKIQKEKKKKLSHEEIICGLKDEARILISRIKKENRGN